MATKVKLNKTETNLISQLSFNRESTEKQTITNPYSGFSCELDSQGVALYDYVIGCEAMGLYNKMSLSLNLFRKLYPDEYYTLLD
jgi:hypothetical protein